MTARGVSYQDWLDDFCYEKKGRGLAEKSINGYRYSVQKFLDFLENNEISKSSYYSYLASLDVSPTSKIHYARDLRCFLYWCQDEGLLPRFKVSLPKAQEPLPKIVSSEDVARLLQRGKTFPEDRMRAVVCLILATGLRARSIVNILTDDVDLENQLIQIRALKSKKVIFLPMTDSLCYELNRYIKRWDLGVWLFPKEDGGQLQSEGLQSAYKRYAHKRGVPYGLHALRHYYATEAVKAGMTPFALQKVLGHTDINVTMRYVNLVNGDLGKEMSKVDLITKDKYIKDR